jgi:transcriptional regulator with XRE-family HTH domain
LSLAEEIRNRRVEQGLSLAELARRADISRAYAHQIENAETGPRPSADVLYRIALALGTSIGELLGRSAPIQEAEVDVPDALRRFAEQEGLSERETLMLARIEFRGKRPHGEDDWRFLWESIKRSVS